MLIQDGTGSNQSAQVVDNKVAVTSRSNNRLFYMSKDRQDAYSWQNVTYDYAAADTILLVKNTDSRALYIQEVAFSGDTATEVVIHCPSPVTTPTGTAVTGVNLNRQSAKVALATAIANETTNTLANAIKRSFMLASTDNRILFDGAVVLGQNQSIAVDFVANGGAALVTITGWFE